MRIVAALSFAALTISSPAWAESVTLAPISFSTEMQTSLEEDIGEREAEILQTAVSDAVARAIARRGATVSSDGAVAIEIEVLDADPNRPTMQQLSNTPGLDAFRSVYRGGAELKAILRASDGRTVEVRHEYYDPSIQESYLRNTTWGTARIAIRRFATKVADAYAELN